MPDMYSTYQLNKQDQADHTRQAAIDKPLRKIPKKREFGATLPVWVIAASQAALISQLTPPLI